MSHSPEYIACRRAMRKIAESFFVGMAIPATKSIKATVEGEDAHYVHSVVTHEPCALVSEKVLKFPKSAMRQTRKLASKNADPRVFGTDDRMVNPVGKPGSRERVDALALQYASLADEEMSPFEEG